MPAFQLISLASSARLNSVCLFAQVPMGRVGTVEKIADVISFLASPHASYITGANLRLDGGMWPGL